MQWFEVDKRGLGKILERRGKSFVLTELIQNAWDENTSVVRIVLEKPNRARLATLTVEDDNPDGFADLTHAFTLFAESAKKANPEQRGRFNLGEKLVLALCERAEISSTRGTVVFGPKGRRQVPRGRSAGTVFTGTLSMTQADFEACCQIVKTLIPPEGIATYFNGQLIESRRPLHELEASLLTDLVDEEGRLVRASRKTRIRVYEAAAGETPSLFEMGIPVLETGDRWHVDIAQKIPLNMERDNVPASYLRVLRTLVINSLHNQLNEQDAARPWIRDALSDKRCSVDAIRKMVALKFGDQCVIYDPSDPEANGRAFRAGYAIVHGRQLSSAEWENVRRAEAIRPAGQVTPSPKPFSDDPHAPPLSAVPPRDWTAGMRHIAHYSKTSARLLLGADLEVVIVNDAQWPFSATYGKSTQRSGRLILNLGRLGRMWFEQGISPEVNELLIHEFGHHYASDHLSDAYHDALCRLGASLTQLALRQPEVFVSQIQDRHEQAISAIS